MSSKQSNFDRMTKNKTARAESTCYYSSQTIALREGQGFQRIFRNESAKSWKYKTNVKKICRQV